VDKLRQSVSQLRTMLDEKDAEMAEMMAAMVPTTGGPVKPLLYQQPKLATFFCTM
jgi:hypothetical protein